MNKAKKRKGIYIVILLLNIAVLLSVLFYYVSKSRHFQFFGNIVVSVPNDKKIIAFTFDDGPTENTEFILERLETLDVAATFFLCGADMEVRPEDVKKIIEKGHAIGSHSYTHKRMLLKPYDFYKKEIDYTNQKIRESGYEDEIFFRPPYGKKLFGLPFYLKKQNMTTVMWSMEPETILGFQADGTEIADYIEQNVKSGDIILLHPMYNPENVMEALELVIPKLEASGYSFLTIPELYHEF